MHFSYGSKDERNHLGIMNSGNKHTKSFLNKHFSPYSFSYTTETKKYFWHLQEGESLKKRNHYRGNCISSIRFFCACTFAIFTASAKSSSSNTL